MHILALEGEGEDLSAHLGEHEERLEQRVEVARGAFVGQSTVDLLVPALFEPRGTPARALVAGNTDGKQPRRLAGRLERRLAFGGLALGERVQSVSHHSVRSVSFAWAQC